MSNLNLLFHNQGKGSPINKHLSLSKTILTTKRNNLVAYWPLNELSGTTADNLEGTSAKDGTYSDVTLGQSQPPFVVPYFENETGDMVNIYSASLASTFDGNEGTLIIFLKTLSSNEWNDNNQRHAVFIQVNTDNVISINQYFGLALSYRSGGDLQNYSHSSVNSPEWIMATITYSHIRGEIKFYIDGQQVNTTRPTGANWSGTISSNTTLIGNTNTLPFLNTTWSGWLAHCAIYNTPLKSNQIYKIYESSKI